MARNGIIASLLATVLLCAALAHGQGQPPVSVQFAQNVSALQAYSSGFKPLPFASTGAGTLFFRFSGITGSPSCTWTVSNGSTNSIAGDSGVTSVSGSITPANGAKFARVGATTGATSVVPPWWSAVSLAYNCSTFPTTGIFSAELIPEPAQFPGYQYAHITTSTTTQVAAFPVVLHSIAINAPGSGETITVYDNASACTTSVVATYTSPTTIQTVIYDAALVNGLCIATTGATPGDYTVTFR